MKEEEKELWDNICKHIDNTVWDRDKECNMKQPTNIPIVSANKCVEHYQ